MLEEDKKTRAHKNATPVVTFYNDEDSDVEIFINGDGHQRFTNYFSGMSMHSDRDFMFDMEYENLGFLGDIWLLIKAMKWTKFCKQPQSYNVQFMKEFYANLIEITSKKAEVEVRGVKVSYS